MEPFYPLHAFVCDNCYLLQVTEFEPPENIFSDYAYFSSYSDSWLEHAQQYTEQMIERFGLDGDSQVVEVASNDGYLLQYFVEKGIPSLGVEPAENVAAEAEKKGVPTIVKFFGIETAEELVSDGKQADLMNGTNVLAQVTDLHGFVEGFRILLKPQGVVTVEFPHLLQLIDENQFDTIYHEHFSYFSFFTVIELFAQHQLKVFDVEELPTFGGSLRIFFCHAGDQTKSVSQRVENLLNREISAGIKDVAFYLRFNEKVKQVKREILEFVLKAKAENKTIACYGAPAKGNTLLNYCGIRTDFIDYTVDRNPHKQNHFLPGTHIPIHHPDKVKETKPDYLVILPWNLKEEIMEQMACIREWGGQFVVFIPGVEVYP
jgi:2-polyprenyl-3-methyl-5-hydroxy-6-metoxy-1,4-benzoquinol methylase